MNSKKYVYLGMGVLIFILILIVFYRLNKDISGTKDEIIYVPSDSIDNKQSPKSDLAKKVIFSDCSHEKSEILQIIKEINNKIKEAKLAYLSSDGDELGWSNFIRNWNLEVKYLKENNSEEKFKCVKSIYFRECLIDLKQIGLFYAFSNISKVHEFERKLSNDVNSTLSELRKYK